MRFVTRTIHAYLDYPVAISLMVLPFVLGLGAGNPLAKWLAVGTGATAFILTVLTDHELGAFKVVPYWLHVAVDRAVGVVFMRLRSHWDSPGLTPPITGRTGQRCCSSRCC